MSEVEGGLRIGMTATASDPREATYHPSQREKDAIVWLPPAIQDVSRTAALICYKLTSNSCTC